MSSKEECRYLVNLFYFRLVSSDHKGAPKLNIADFVTQDYSHIVQVYFMANCETKGIEN